MSALARALGALTSLPKPDFHDEGVRRARPLAQAALHRALRGSIVATADLGVRSVRERISDHFGMGHAGHCFTAEPHFWANFHEPQITGGLSWFLNFGDRRTKIGRAFALMEAAGQTGMMIHATSKIEVSSESLGVGRTRLDLLAVAETSSGMTFGTVIEAKIGHTVSNAQLSGYENTVQAIYGLKPSNCTFTLMVRTPTRDVLATIRRHPAWRITSWERFLVDFERALAPLGVDDDDFRRFRQTIWRRIAR